MSRKKSHARPPGKGTFAVPSVAARPDVVLVEKIATVHGAAAELVTEDDLDALPDPGPLPERLSLDQCWKLAREAEVLYDRARQRAADAERRSNAACRDAEEAQSAARAERDRLREQAERATALAAALDAREARCVEQERELGLREANARAGFAVQSRQAAEALQDEVAALEAQLAESRATVARERRELGETLARSRAEHEHRLADEAQELRSRLANERAVLEAARAETDRERLALVRERHELATERELFALDCAAVDERVARRSDAHIRDANERAELLQAQLHRAREDRERLRAALAEREEADLRFGHLTPEAALDELDRLRREADGLRAELAVRPPAELQERFAELDAEREEWRRDRVRLQGENRRLEVELSRRMIAATDLETLRDHRVLLETRNKLLHEKAELLRREVDELAAREGTARVFPACHTMDEEAGLQDVPRLHLGEIDLAKFVGDLRQRIAGDPERARQGLDPLYYSAADLRAFVGGLAMSRLHILQGISGTGKTSLPIAFARAVGAGCEVVEVQAGWRDRDDLVGHYNAFERRFHEREFLKALYRAQCPAFADRVFVVVLDEMNLSHPEHYFADLLSGLEQDPAQRRLVLLSAAASAPRLMRDGRTLPIPPNVWFVGTANHDETTREFADKTYDRAHVMELPRHHERFEVRPPRERAPVSYAALEQAFDQASQRHEKASRQVYAAVEEELARVLRDRFGVGWGNRFERQLLRFYPVVVEAGGAPGEAVDHLVCTKLLRKLRDRHGSSADALRSLQEAVERLAERIDPDTPPVHSIALIEDELRRHDEGEALV